MSRNFKEAMRHRRSYYSISSSSPTSDDEIKQIVESAVKDVPSAFNSQSSRVIILLGENHKKLWEITKVELEKIAVSPEAFIATENKINNSFLSGHGTLLFYEDQSVIKGLQEAFPLYHDRFPIWSQHTSAMHQFAIWTMLEDVGLGVSLQHYNPLIDNAVAEVWKIDPEWQLIAQMPFGAPVTMPREKDYNPLNERVLLFK